MDWEGEIREVKCSLTSLKEMDLLSPTCGLKPLREGCNLESTRRLQPTSVGPYTCEALIEKL
jgi:hypothetical protein